MAQVGIVRYDADADTYTGEFRSLSLSAPIVFKPNPDIDVKGKRPAYRIYARGDVEIGGAWRNTNKEGNEYISVKIGAPELPKVIYANLGRALGQDDPDVYALIWNPPE